MASAATWTDLWIGLLRRWHGESFYEDARREIFAYSGKPDKLSNDLIFYRDNNDPRYYLMTRPLAFFEDLGILVCRENILSARLVKANLASVIKTYWSWYEPFIMHCRDAYGVKTTWEWFEKLKQKM